MSSSTGWLVSYYLTGSVVFIHILEPTVLLLTLAFTGANSILRIAIFPIVILVFIQAVSLDSNPETRKIYRIFLSDWATVVLLQYIDTSLISRWDYSYGGPTSGNGGFKVLPPRTPSSSSSSFSSRLRWAFHVTINQRWTNTPWAIKNIPSFSSRDPTYVPGRFRFVTTRLTFASIAYLVVAALSANDADPTEIRSMFPAEEEKILSPPLLLPSFFFFSGEMLARRVAATASVWITSYCILVTIYNVISAGAVAVHLSDPADWRPLFGSLTQLTSIRSFWNGFWQQGMRTRFSHPAHWLVYHVLGLRHGRPFSRYLFILVTFAVSGVVHAVGDLAAGMDLYHESGSIRFFVVQTFGIMFEDAVQEVWRNVFYRGRKAGREEEEKEKGEGSWKTKWIGYCWTLWWLCWTSPVWQYPMLRNNDGSEADVVLPFNVWTDSFTRSGFSKR